MITGGKLILETSNVRLDEEYARSHLWRQAGDYVMLAVTDTGIGIDPEIRCHLFEPFFTTKERGKGTGLGLSTSYGIVKQNGGDIWVDSEPGKGTTFKIYLPVAAERAAPVPERHGASPVYGNETILLVEDDGGVRAVLQTMLQRHGYHVLSCGVPEHALEICSSYAAPIHLVITDIIMPHVSGRELAEKLLALRPKVQVLYVSGYAETVEDETLDVSANYLQKPFTPDALAAKIRELLSKKRASTA